MVQASGCTAAYRGESVAVINIAAIDFPPIDPVLFRLGPLAVRWYGIAYLLGFLLAYLALTRLVRRGDLRLSRERLSDLLAWLIAGVLLGGRLGWWLFYHRGGPEPWYEPFAVWHGGMSFHGGLAGVAIALALWTWVNRAQFWNIADCLALVAPIGLFLGRIANFINAELVGRATDLPWGVVFPGESVPRHPSQFYEALLEGPLLAVVLWTLWGRERRPADGRTGAAFMVGYGVFRFLVEFTRQPDEQLGFVAGHWLTMGQLLSVALVFAGLALWWARRSRVDEDNRRSRSRQRWTPSHTGESASNT